jgi:hypothetical protein
MVIEKEIGFEFIEISDFEAPASNAAKQSAQDRFIQVRGRGKDDVPEIGLAIFQRDAEDARVRALIFVIADYLRHSFLVDSNAPDFDGLANTQFPIDHERRAMVTDVNGLAFAQEVFTAFRGGRDTNAQIHKDPFAAAEVLA